MSADWPIVTLKEAGITLIDCDHKTPKAQEEGLPYVGIPQLKDGRIVLDGARLISEEDFHHWRRKAKPTPDDVILSRRCNPGEIAYVPENLDIALGQNLVLLRSDGEKVYPPFLRWLAQGSNWWHQVNKFINVGAVFDSLKCADIPKFEFRLPPMEDQKRIAKTLGDLDKKIELNRQTNQTLEQIAQAIFKSWFVDFEPSRAKIAAKQAGQDPERAAMAAISGLSINDAAGATLEALDSLQQTSPEQYEQLKTTAALFPDALVNSELGEIPEGWEAKAFGELLSKTIGGDWGKEEPDEKHTEKVKILRGTDLPSVYAGSDEKVPTRFVDPKKLATRKLEAGDIVIEVSGGSKDQPTGRSLFLTREIIDRLNSDLEPASFCRLFRPINIEVGLMLGLHLQKIYADGKTWQYQNQSTGISNFQTKVFLERELVVLPKQELVSIFFNSVMPFLQKISSAENQNLEKTRDTLLPKLLSGELVIKRDVV